MSSKAKAVAAALAAALLAGCATAPGGAQFVPLIDIKPEQGAAKALILSVRSEA